MAYKEKPDATDAKNISQADIKENFTQLSSFAGQDHVSFAGAAGDLGKHEKVTFTEQAADQTTAADEMALYLKDAGTEPNLYLRKESDGTVFNMTPDATGHVTTGYEVLPSGLMFCWGTAVCGVGSTSANDTFAKAFIAGSPFQVITSASGVGGGKTDAQNVAFSTTYTTTVVTFTRSRAENAFTLRYLAIGLPA